MREKLLFQEQPDPFHGVKFRMIDATLLPDAGFILEKEPDFLALAGFANLLQALGEPPLKASCAASSFSG